jgi:hypothetical protein
MLARDDLDTRTGGWCERSANHEGDLENLRQPHFAAVNRGPT